MRCPYCGNPDTQVKDFAAVGGQHGDPPAAGMPGLRRALHDLRARPAARADRGQDERPARAVRPRQAARSVQMALRKRPVEQERVERMVNGIVRQLESRGDSDIPSERIGQIVMEGLNNLDEVAYVRFASVYRNFRDTEDFKTVLGELSEPARPRRAERHGRPPKKPPAAVDPDFDRRMMAAALASAGATSAAPGPIRRSAASSCARRRRPSWSDAAGRQPGGRPHAEKEALGRPARPRGALRRTSRSSRAPTRAG